MRVLLFTFVNLAALLANATQSFSGVLLKDSGQFYLSSNSQCGRYGLRNPSEKVFASLRKLNHGDALTATGIIDTLNCLVEIRTIDYVGLKRLLGNWQTESGLISVKDFTSIIVYPRVGTLENSFSHREIPNPLTYRYSVLPTPGKDWVVFLSDETTTTFATLSFHRTSATLRMYDSESGNLTSEIRMIRWKNQK